MVVDLLAIYNALREGANAADYFTDLPEERQQSQTSDVNARLAAATAAAASEDQAPAPDKKPTAKTAAKKEKQEAPAEPQESKNPPKNESKPQDSEPPAPTNHAEDGDGEESVF